MNLRQNSLSLTAWNALSSRGFHPRSATPFHVHRATEQKPRFPVDWGTALVPVTLIGGAGALHPRRRDVNDGGYRWHFRFWVPRSSLGMTEVGEGQARLSSTSWRTCLA